MSSPETVASAAAAELLPPVPRHRRMRATLSAQIDQATVPGPLPSIRILARSHNRRVSDRRLVTAIRVNRSRPSARPSGRRQRDALNRSGRAALLGSGARPVWPLATRHTRSATDLRSPSDKRHHLFAAGPLSSAPLSLPRFCQTPFVSRIFADYFLELFGLFAANLIDSDQVGNRHRRLRRGRRHSRRTRLGPGL